MQPALWRLFTSPCFDKTVSEDKFYFLILIFTDHVSENSKDEDSKKKSTEASNFTSEEKHHTVYHYMKSFLFTLQLFPPFPLVKIETSAAAELTETKSKFKELKKLHSLNRFKNFCWRLLI